MTQYVDQELAERVAHAMLARDQMSQWLRLTIEAIAPGSCRCRMLVRSEMVNGFGVSHGGVAFSFADSAFAFACNTHGRVTVSVDSAISYPAAVYPGDELTADACEESGSNRLSYCRVDVRNQHGVVVALFRGTAYKTSTLHFPDE